MQTWKFVHVVETVTKLPPSIFLMNAKIMQLGFYKILATIQIFPYAEKKLCILAKFISCLNILQFFEDPIKAW